MKKNFAAIIFSLMIFFAYMAFDTIVPQFFDWRTIYKTLFTRLGSERGVAAFLLVIYLFMSIMVLIAFGRWIVYFSRELVLTISHLREKDAAAARQTLDNTLIIDNPKLKRPVVRFLETIFSATVWLFFVYLFQTIPATFVWVFGLDRIYSLNLSERAIQGTLDAIFLMVHTAMTCFTILVLWAQWNYWRFGRLERRKPRPNVNINEIASFFSIPISMVRQIQESKIATITPLNDDSFTFKKQQLE